MNLFNDSEDSNLDNKISPNCNDLFDKYEKMLVELEKLDSKYKLV